MKPEIKYILWEKSVIEAARALHKAAHSVGVTGLRALDTYNEAHHKLWEALDREPSK